MTCAREIRVLASYDQELALRPGYAEARDDRGAVPRESAGPRRRRRDRKQ